MSKAFLGGVIIFFLVLSAKTTLDLNPWLELMISAIAALATYLAYTVAFHVIRKDEIRLLGKAGIPIPNIFVKIFNKL